jgi:hypothetical protein
MPNPGRISSIQMQDVPALHRLQELIAKAELPIDNADERRRRAQQALDQALQLATGGHFPLGPHRRRCLASALVAIRAGYYDLALSEVAAALHGDDTPAVSTTSPPGYSVEDLKRELDIVRGYPLIER